MASRARQLKRLLVEALAKPSPMSRAAYLNKVCAGKPLLRQELTELIDAYESAGDFLEGNLNLAGSGSFPQERN